MSPISTTHAELQIAVSRAIKRADELRQRLGRTPRGIPDAGELLDHRAAVAGDIADALDRIEAGLGLSWMRALYPEVPFAEAETPEPAQAAS
ncbi:hypothetical protein MASR1M6_11460 [Rubrivivax sp.]